MRKVLEQKETKMKARLICIILLLVLGPMVAGVLVRYEYDLPIWIAVCVAMAWYIAEMMVYLEMKNKIDFRELMINREETVEVQFYPLPSFPKNPPRDNVVPITTIRERIKIS